MLIKKFKSLSNIIIVDHPSPYFKERSFHSPKNTFLIAILLLARITWRVPFRRVSLSVFRRGNLMILPNFRTLQDFRNRCCWLSMNDCSGECTTAISWRRELRRAFSRFTFFGFFGLTLTFTRCCCLAKRFSGNVLFFARTREKRNEIDSCKKEERMLIIVNNINWIWINTSVDYSLDLF